MYQMVDWSLVFEGLFLLAHTFVLFLFPFTFLISSYFFVFFKLQVGPWKQRLFASPINTEKHFGLCFSFGGVTINDLTKTIIFTF